MKMGASGLPFYLIIISLIDIVVASNCRIGRYVSISITEVILVVLRYTLLIHDDGYYCPDYLIQKNCIVEVFAAINPKGFGQRFVNLESGVVQIVLALNHGLYSVTNLIREEGVW